MRLTSHGQLGTQQWANVFWIRNGAAVTPTAGNFEAFVQNVANLIASIFLPHQSQTLTFGGIHGLYYGSAEIDLGVDVPDGRTGGASAGTDLSANVALCVSWQVQQHYRGGHPRNYFAGMRTTMAQDVQSWTPAQISTWHDAANNFNNQVNSLANGEITGPRLGVVSFVLRNQWRTPPVFRDFINGAAVVDSRIDSMRRRLGPDR